MIIRAILGLVLSGGLSIGALYGAGEYLGIRGATADEIADIEPGEPEAEDAGDSMMEPSEEMSDDMAEGYADDEGPVDDRLPLPYEEGEAAVWLASVLEGSGPYDVDGASIDLAALAATASTGEGASASCDSSHVAFSCSLVDEASGVLYNFGLQNNAEGGYEIPDGNVRAYAAD